MARKENKQDRGTRILNSGWSEAELNDPSVLSLRKRLEEEEARRKAQEEERARVLEEQRRAEEERKQWENVQGGSASTEAPRSARPLDAPQEAPTSDIGAIINSISTQFKARGLADDAQELIRMEGLQTPEARERFRAELLSSRPTSNSEGAISGHAARVSRGLELLAKAEELAKTPDGINAAVGDLMQRKAALDQDTKQTEGYFDSTGSYIARTAADVLGAPKQFLSIPGALVGAAGFGTAAAPSGPGALGAAALGAKVGSAVGAIPQAIDTYQGSLAEAYLDMRKNGTFTPENLAKAKANAVFETSMEYGFELAGGALAARFGLDGVAKKFLEERIASNVGRGAAKLAGRVGVGAAEEVGAQIATDIPQQIYAQTVLGENPNDPTAKYLANKMPTNPVTGEFDPNAYASNLKRIAAAGAAAAGGFAVPTTIAETRRDNKNLLTDMAGNGLDRNYGKATGDAAPTTEIDPRPSQDMFGTPEGLPSVEEYQTQRQEQNVADAQLTIEQRKQSEQRAREREIAYTQREIAQIKKNSTPYTLQQDFQRVQELENKLANLQPQPTQQEAETTPAQAEPVQEDMFPLDNSQLIADANAEAKERNKKVTDFDKDQKKKANDKRTSARKAFERSTLLNLDPNMPAPQKAQALDAALIEWDAANPIENYQTAVREAQLKADAKKAGKKLGATVVPSTRNQAAVVEEAETSDAPLSDPADVLGKLKAEQQERNNTLKMEGNKPVIQESNDPDVISTVFNLIKSKINTEKGATIGRLMAAGKVKIVDRLPDGNAGEYDGNTTYISAEHVLENGGFAAIVDVAGHEIKHGVDVAGAKATLDNTTNDSIIAGLRQAALRGDEDAISSWALATGQSDADLTKVKLGIPTNKTQRLELAARGINYANIKAQQTGRLESIGRSVLSSIRTKYKNVTGQSYNVNINDLDYLAKRMLKDVALKNVNIKGDLAAATEGNTLPMFVGENASLRPEESEGLIDAQLALEFGNDPETVRKATGWFKGEDDKWRFEIDDSEADFITPFKDLEESPTIGKEKVLPLSDVIDHKELFEKYPFLKDFKFVKKKSFMDVYQNVQGWFDPTTKTVVVTPYAENPISTIMHEIQHVIQDKELFAVGGSPKATINLLSEQSKEDAAQSLIRIKDEELASRDALVEKLAANRDLVKQHVAADKAEDDSWYMVKEAKNAVNADTPEGQQLIKDRTAPWLAARKEAIELKKSIKNLLEMDMANWDDYSTKQDILDAYIEASIKKNRDDIVKDTSDRAGELVTEINALQKDRDAVLLKELDKGGVLYKLYQQLAGETESRNVEKRRKLNKEQRREQSPADTQDVPGEDQIVRFRSEGMIPSVDKPTLAMAATTRKSLPKAAKRDDTRGANTWRGIKRLLGSYGGHEEQLVKAGTAGKGESSALSYEAEYLAKTANHAIKAAISQSKSSRADIMKKVTEAVESSNAEGGSETQRARMLKSQLDQAFPGTGLGDAFNAMRAFKWKMSQDLVDFRLRDKRLMDTKEVNIYTKIMTEAEKWTTRAYLNDLDKGYAKRFLKNAENNPDSEDRRKLEVGIDWLVNNSLLIPDDQALEETNLGNLQRMLSNWDASESKDLKKIKDTDERREAMIARLVELRDMGGDNARTKAMAIIEDMLMTKGSNTFVGKEVRGMKQNRTVLEARAQLPSELRDVLGEVTDPFLREAISLARLTGLVGQTKALTQIYEEGADKFYSTTSNGNFKFPLEGAAFGPLAGMYVNKDTKDFLGSYVATLGQYDTTLQEALETPRAGWQLAAQGIGKAIGAVASQAKVAGVVLNMGNMAMNLAGAPLYAVANGVNPKHYWPSFRTAMDIARGNVARIQDPARRAEAEEALRAQAVDSAAVQEMRGGPWKLIEGEIDKATGKGMWARAWKAKGRPQEAAAEIYAAMDVWTKIASYKQNKEFLTEYNHLENKGWTPEQIEQEAGLQANRTNISWSAAVPIVKFAEQNIPWLTAFATYKTEVVRSTAMMGKSILQDIALAKSATTPEAKSLASQRAAARFFGTMISVVAPVAATVGNLITESDEEKEKREAFAEWDKNRIQVYLGKDANGREHFFNLNRLDPKGVVNDAITDVWQGIGEGKGLEAMEKAVTGLFFGQFGRFVGAHTLLNDIAAATWGKPLKDKKDPQTLISGTKVDNFLRDYVGLGADVGVNTERLVQDMFVPGQMTVALDKDVLNIVEGNKTAASWLKGLGLKGNVQDPDKMVKNAGWEYQKEVSKLKEKSKKLLEKSTSEEAKIEDLLDLVAKEQEAFSNLQKKTAAYDAFDAPQFIEGKKQGVKAKRTFGQAAELLMSDAGGKLAKKDISKLQSGKFVSGILTDDLIKTYEETLLSKLDRNSPTYNEEKQDAKSRAALLRQVYLEKKKENK